MNDSNTLNLSTNDCATQYITAGWDTPIPLPAGAKFPPTAGMTGRIPEVPAEKVRDAWEGAKAGANVGLRMPDGVIGIDIDQYGSKTGADTMAALEEAYGTLNLDTVPRSTRRGIDSPSAQYFFQVPKGTHWDSKAGKDIDVIQFTHRYSAVYPSIVEGDQYKWYLGDEELDSVPHVKDLPTLPEKWVAKLTSTIPLAQAPAEPFIPEEAEQWLELAAPGYLDEISPALQTKIDWVKEAMANNSHDTALNAHYSAIKWVTCVEDGPAPAGLKATLKEIDKIFLDVHASRDKQRASQFVLEQEVSRSRYGAVNAVRGEIEAGLATPRIQGKDVTSLDGAQSAREDLVEAVRQVKAQNSPLQAIAYVIAVTNEDLVVHIAPSGKDELMDMSTNKEPNTRAIRTLLNDYALVFFDMALTIAEEEDEYLTGLRNRVIQLGDGSRLDAFVDQLQNALIAQGRARRVEQLNTNPDLIGYGNEVLDFQLAAGNPDGTLVDWLRPREVDDMVTYTIPEDADLRTGCEHMQRRPENTQCITQKLIEAVFPDPEVRAFAQAAYGHSIHGRNQPAKVFVAHGTGGSGKGSMSDSIEATLGKEYVSRISLGQFSKGCANSPDTSYRDSLKTRITFIDETDPDTTISSSMLKRATEYREGRAMYGTTVVGSRDNVVWIMTNNIFSFNSDTGTQRRLAVIPFNSPEKSVREAQRTYENDNWRERPEERAFMVTWLLRGWLASSAENSMLEWENYPVPIADKTRDFVQEADPTQKFFSRLTRTGNTKDFLSTADMVTEYNLATGESGGVKSDTAVTMNINRWFANNGYEKDKSRKGTDKIRGYRGWIFGEPMTLDMPKVTNINSKR